MNIKAEIRDTANYFYAWWAGATPSQQGYAIGFFVGFLIVLFL